MYDVWTGHIMTGEWLLTVRVEILADIERVADVVGGRAPKIGWP